MMKKTILCAAVLYGSTTGATSASSAVSVRYANTSPRRTSVRLSNGLQKNRRPCSCRSTGTAAFVDPSEVLGALGSIARNPYASAFAVCAVKGATADYLAQRSQFNAASGKNQQRRSHTIVGGRQRRYLKPWRGGGSDRYPSYVHDYKRQLAFLLYAGLYQGMGLEYIYNTLFPQLFGPQNLFLKVVASMFVLTPLVTLPLAYLVKALVLGQSMSAALGRYGEDITQRRLLQTFWKIWVPVQTVAFALVPEHFRITFLAGVSFLWMILFSRISSSSK